MNSSLGAGDICTRSVVGSHRDLAVDEVARRMREHHVGCLVVVDDTAAGRRPVGLLTDRDIVTVVVAKYLEPRILHAGDVMNAGPVIVPESDSLLDALAAMRRAGARRVPATDQDGLLQGLLYSDDVIEAVGEQIDVLVKVLDSARQREPRRRP